MQNFNISLGQLTEKNTLGKTRSFHEMNKKLMTRAQCILVG